MNTPGYTITYSPNVFTSESKGDAYNFQETLKNLSEMGSIVPNTSSPTGLTDIPTITADYNTPYVYYDNKPWPFQDDLDYDHPHLSVQDAANLDQIDLNYTYASDGAKADYHLLVNFHLPYEKWTQTGNPAGDENDSTPYVSVPINPSPAQGGQSATANPLSAMNTIAFGGTSATFTGISALMGEVPPVAAFMAVTGYVVDKLTPVPPDDTQDGIQNFTASIAQTQTAINNPALAWESLCNDPAWLAAQAGDNAAAMTVQQAQCTWTLFAQTPVWTFHYLGDQYGAFGFVGQVPTNITQAGNPAWFHYYTYSPPKPPPPPINP